MASTWQTTDPATGVLLAFVLAGASGFVLGFIVGVVLV